MTRQPAVELFRDTFAALRRGPTAPSPLDDEEMRDALALLKAEGRNCPQPLPTTKCNTLWPFSKAEGLTHR